MARRAPVALLLVVVFLQLVVASVHAGGTISRRRLLQVAGGNSTDTNGTASYVSYDALRRDTVPCNLPGASYYNCRVGGDANPYQRSCSAITQCRD